VPELRAVQALVSELIRATDGVERTLARTDTPHRCELLDLLAATVTSDARLGAVKRLEVYANAYFYRILDCLKEDFSVLLANVGDARFHDLVTAYLLVHPSNHFSMRYVGQRMPQFIAAHASMAAFRSQFPWAADLARLEWALLDAFDAADVPKATRQDFATVDPEEFAELQFFLDPSVQCLELDSRAVRRQRAHGAVEAEDSALESEGGGAPREHVLVWRRDETVRTRPLAPAEARALDCVARGKTFGEICVEVAGLVGEEQAASQVAGWLAAWLEVGCLAKQVV